MEKQPCSNHPRPQPTLWLLLGLSLALFFWPQSVHAGNFTLQKLDDGVFAALANPGGQATSNALIVVSEDAAVVAGAHFSQAVIEELQGICQLELGRPIRYFILAHHHPGYSHIDFDFPPTQQVIMTVQSWKAIQQEKRVATYQPLFFNQGLTLKLGRHTLILNDLERGHSEGDLFLYLPESKVLFTSDLFYNGSVGYLGEGYMQDWVLALELLKKLDAKTIVPGLGSIAGQRELVAYQSFLRAFLTETLAHLEAGDSLQQTLEQFKLPQYEKLSGFEQFKKVNVTRAYQQLKQLRGD